MLFRSLWLLFGIIAGMIGSSKGEGCLSFILGILLGPFGILFAIFSKGNQKDCPYCTKRVPEKARVCPFCQSSLTGKQRSSQQASAVAPVAQPTVPAASAPAPPPPPQYFLFINGQQTGPFTQSQIAQMATAGMVAPTALVWAPGYADWVEVQSAFPQTSGNQGANP